MMDDDMEDEIVCQLFTTHLHLIWKYVRLTSTSIVEFVLPGPGESFKSKILQPGPFMLFTFLLIISSLFLQSRQNWLQKLILSCHKSISLNVVADNSLKSFVSASICNTDNIVHEFVEGIVGIYALQGRRATMEDRFCVMQQVDVGGKNKLSLFGVYDGHGGQYVAEYVKQNLFVNTVDKIKQLQSLNRNGKLGNRKNGIKKNKNNNCDNNENSKNKSNLESTNIDVNTDRSETGSDKEPNGRLPLLEETIKNIKEEEEKERKAKEEEEDGKKRKEGNKIEDILNVDDLPNGECILKKEDPYSSANLKKKSVTSQSKEVRNGVTKEVIKKRDDDDDVNSYIDINANINYTKLLTDQMIAIDKKIVDHCKSKTDLSGTTAVIAVLDGELLVIGNVGDSRAVMGDLKGSTIPLSFDHKPNQLKEMRRIKEAGGFITFTGVWRVAGILATSRALGDFPLKDPRKLITAEPDVLTFSLKDHKAHFVILATDGLWDVLSNEEAVAFVIKHIHERDNGAKSLVMHAYSKGSMDNITVSILNLKKLSA